MKKILTILAVLFVVNCSAQDTTYIQKRNELYRQISTRVTDTAIYNRYYTLEYKKQRRRDNTFMIVVGTIFTGLSVWFFGGGYYK